MKISAIISEYNPFHNGHAYHADTTRRETDADYVLSIMSGNFVQRGEPAVLNKYARAGMALDKLDAVFELPTVYAISNAGDFAKGAVSILDAIGCINYLSFGVETDDMNPFDKICDILTKEQANFKASLRDHLKEGTIYPLARELALKDILGDKISEIASSPNNILAIEYICALRTLDSNIIPHIIKRRGSYHIMHESPSSILKTQRQIVHKQIINDILNYNNSDSNIDNTSEFLSASAIRRLIADKNDISEHVPSIVLDAIKKTPCITENSTLDTLLNLRLTELTDDTPIHELSGDMLNRLRSITIPVSFDDAVQQLKTRNITYTRSSRALLNLILGIKADDFNVITKGGYAHYANLLSFRRDSSPLIKLIQDASRIPIINKKSDYHPVQDAESLSWYYDCKATDIYNTLYYCNSKINNPSELSSNLVIL